MVSKSHCKVNGAKENMGPKGLFHGLSLPFSPRLQVSLIEYKQIQFRASELVRSVCCNGSDGDNGTPAFVHNFL
jgi:hypothetical protein